MLLLGLGFYCIITFESRKMALRTAKKFLVFLMDTNKVRNIGMDKKKKKKTLCRLTVGKVLPYEAI